MTTELESHDFTTSDGIRIHYLTQGAEGSRVVLHHGYTSSADGNWVRNGVMAALAKRHRVVAIDGRNHGKSDKPTPRGPSIPGDVLELMNHLDIERAHLHGYSMGGAITARVLAEHENRLITASFGGSGIRETEEAWIARVPPEPEGSDPAEAEIRRTLRISSLMNDGMTREQAQAALEDVDRERAQVMAGARRQVLEIDVPAIGIPLLAINGEFDSPYAKTFRLWRQARDFTNVILPGKGHLSAIAAGYMPPQYLTSLTRFIDSNDRDDRS